MNVLNLVYVILCLGSEQLHSRSLAVSSRSEHTAPCDIGNQIIWTPSGSGLLHHHHPWLGIIIKAFARVDDATILILSASAYTLRLVE